MSTPSKFSSGIQIGIGSPGVDYQKTEAKNMVLQNLLSDPLDPVEGQEYYNSATKRRRYFNGTVWIEDVVLTPETAASIGALIAGSSNKNILVDADKIPISDSVASGVLKYWSYANLKTQLLDWLQGLNFLTNSSTHTLTNKSINASNNPITNLILTMFGGGVIDTDGTLAADSDDKLATQKAVNTKFTANRQRSTHLGTQTASTISDFAATVLATVLAGISFVTSSAVTNSDSILVAIGKLQAQINSLNAVDGVVFKGVINASANPNYPAANAGDMYKFSVAGKIGGSSGVPVNPQDTMYCTVDGSGANNHATVGANWTIIEGNVDYATSSVPGIVRLATAIEVKERESSAAVVTPATMQLIPSIGEALIGNGSLTDFTITESTFGALVKMVQVFESGELVFPTITEVGTGNSFDISFPTPPSTNQYLVVYSYLTEI